MQPRIALFTHDAYGLGHVRRSVRILRAVAAAEPRCTLLLVTGSPATRLLQGLPPNADYLKIPTIVTSGEAGTKPPTLGIGVAELASLRGQIVKAALETFEPDVFLVDNFPLGTRLELLPVLRALRHRPTRTVLGLRDIVDPPEKVRIDWARDGIPEILDRYYDRIVVYGMREVLDAEEAYALTPSVATKLTYCGYVSDADSPRSAAAGPSSFDGALLATVGGGGDGLPVLEAFVRALPLLGGPRAVVVTGEFMSQADRLSLQALGAAQPNLSIVDYVDDLPSAMAASKVTVAMAGYNTCAEILAAGARAVLVPRTWRSGEHGSRDKARVDAEQLVRAQALERMGLVGMLHPKDLTPERMAQAVEAEMTASRPPGGTSIELDGASRVAEVLLELAREGR